MHSNDDDQIVDAEIVDGDPERDVLDNKFESLVSLDATEENLDALRLLLSEAEAVRYMKLVRKLLIEIGSVMYDLKPHLDDAFQAAVESGEFADLLEFQRLMDANHMPNEAYPDDYDELMVQLHPGVPLPQEFKSEFIKELDLWRSYKGQLQLTAHKAIRQENAALAGYILALYYTFSETAERLGIAAEQLVYDLGAVVSDYRAQYEEPMY